jgi:hypothetical protein
MSKVPPHTPEAYGLTPLVGGTRARGYILFLAGLANSIRAFFERRTEAIQTAVALYG